MSILIPNKDLSIEMKNALDEIISSKQKITCWYKLNDDGTTEYNHYENFWVTVDKPNILFKDSVEQKQWKNLNWKKKYAILYDGTIFDQKQWKNINWKKKFQGLN